VSLTYAADLLRTRQVKPTFADEIALKDLGDSVGDAIDTVKEDPEVPRTAQLFLVDRCPETGHRSTPDHS
jgi:hypothetical protein